MARQRQAARDAAGVHAAAGSRSLTGWKAGRLAGESGGWQHGYHQGRCEAVLRQLPQHSMPPVQLRVMYVVEGTPGYYGIDTGIVQALREQVSQVYVASPGPDLPRLAARFKPDLMLCLNVRKVPPQQVLTIRRLGIKTAVWFTDDPYFTDLTTGLSRSYDYVFTHELGCVAYYRRVGCRQVHYMPLAVNPAVYYPKRTLPAHRTDILFVGTAFANRLALFDQIAPYLAGKKVLIAGGFWNRMKHYALLKGNIRLAGIRPPHTALYYSGARIVINLHRPLQDRFNSRRLPALSINPRTYEAAACGSLVLTDVRQDLARYYKPGEEIAVYTSPADLVHKLEHYMKHEEQRREIALGGLRRTMLEHTYARRIRHMLQIMYPGRMPKV